jgi:hypothetical protein
LSEGVIRVKFRQMIVGAICAIGLGGAAMPAAAGQFNSNVYTPAGYMGVHDGNGSSWNPDWKRRDCHRRADRHWVRGYGRVLHRHVGPRCRVQILRPRGHWHRGDRDRLHCFRIGSVEVCYKD